MMQAYPCKECLGTGLVEFTKERGGPTCNSCNGKGHMTKTHLRMLIGSILDYPSIYMGGPSRGSLNKADKILKCFQDKGIEFPE